MIQSKKDVERIAEQFRKNMTEEMVRFICDVGYVNRGTYEGNKDAMLINEGKRELALTIKTLATEPVDAILAHFVEVSE